MNMIAGKIPFFRKKGFSSCPSPFFVLFVLIISYFRTAPFAADVTPAR